MAIQRIICVAHWIARLFLFPLKGALCDEVVMTLHVTERTGLPASQSPYRIVDEDGRELEWANKFLDVQCVRGLARLSLRAYGNTILHFVRWWQQQPGVDVRDFRADNFTESTLVDYVRAQVDQRPKPSPENINGRSGMLRRLFRFHFQQDMPHAPYGIQRNWFRQTYRGGRRPFATADLKLKVPQRAIEPLTRDQVARFWHSFKTARDMAIVALMVLNGLRSREVLGLTLEDLLFSEAQAHVRGKGGRARRAPLPPETIRLLQSYLKTERPLSNEPRVFVCLKGRSRGQAMTPAGLRSLFRHHRKTTDVHKANPHRFRHTFGSDMVRAGVSLPALMRLMGHAYIQTTLLYIQLSPQDVFAEYARAVERISKMESKPLS
jgi:integrase